MAKQESKVQDINECREDLLTAASDKRVSLSCLLWVRTLFLIIFKAQEEDPL